MPDARSSQIRSAAGQSSHRGLASTAGPSDITADNDHAGADDMTVISTRGPIAEGSEGPLLQPLEVGKILEGERLGQFVLQKYVGGGGMGVVFKALDTTLNREVAVKVLARSQSQDEETLRRFQNEAQSAARLDHANIARVYYVGQDRGVHYIVFEFIEGINIRDLVQQVGPLPLADAISYTLQVAEALAHASQRDVIHRDIKPSNVLITPDGKAKLVDMGLARLLQVDQTDNDLTASGVTLGTFDYISPEQARDPRSADVRSDLYSLGCSFYFMLTGRPPFPDGTVLQKLLQHQGDAPTDPRNFRPDLPVEVTTILTRLLAKNPARRYQQPAELIAELSVVGEHAGLPSTAFAVNYRPVPQYIPPAAWHKHLPWAVPLAALILIVLALDYVWSGATPITLPDVGTPGRAKPPAPAVSTPLPMGQPLPADIPRANTDDSGAAHDPMPSLTPGAPGDIDGPRLGAAPDGVPPAKLSLEKLSQWLGGLRSSDDGLKRLRKWFAAPPSDEPHVASATGAPQPAAAPNPARSSVPRPGTLVVIPDRQGAGIFASLAAAVGAAKAGDVIELDFDGRHEERPLTLTNTALKIRAADGRKPIVAFRPADADPVAYPRSMVTVAGGSLTITGVELELDVPRRISADAWTLVETRRAELVHIEQSVLTVHNASSGGGAFHPAVSVFDVKSPPGSDSVTMATVVGNMPVCAIDLSECLIRGEATVLRSDELEPVRLRLAGCLVATTETLLLSRGAEGTARAGAVTKIDLRQVTALALGGLIRMANDEDSSHLLTIELRAEDCLLMTAAGFPMVDQRGIDSADRFRQLIEWSATNVLFAGTDQFWRMTNVSSGQTTQLDFAAWEDYWGSNRESDCRPVASAPLVELLAREKMSLLVPAVLTGALRQAATIESSGSRPLGCNLDMLPAPIADSFSPAGE